MASSAARDNSISLRDYSSSHSETSSFVKISPSYHQRNYSQVMPHCTDIFHSSWLVFHPEKSHSSMKGPLQPFCLIWFGCFPHVITSVFHSCNSHYRDKIVRYINCDPWCSFYVKLHPRYHNSARKSEAQAVVNRTSHYRSYNH